MKLTGAFDGTERQLITGTHTTLVSSALAKISLLGRQLVSSSNLQMDSAAYQSHSFV